MSWLNQAVFWQGVAASLVAAGVCFTLEVVVPVVRRRMRGAGIDVSGEWRCEWQSSSPTLAPIESETVEIRLTWDGRLKFRAGDDASVPWKAVGEFTKDRRHVTLDWTLKKTDNNDMVGASLLYVTPSAKFMAGHWYGETIEGEQSYGWSVLYPASDFGADERARDAAHEWLKKRITDVLPGRPVT